MEPVLLYKLLKLVLSIDDLFVLKFLSIDDQLVLKNPPPPATKHNCSELGGELEGPVNPAATKDPWCLPDQGEVTLSYCLPSPN